MAHRYGKIFKDSFWTNNITLSQSLALCPTMAVTSTATNALGMGLATTAVLVVSNVMIASLRNFITNEVRIPVFVVIIASLVTLVDMTMNAWLHQLYGVLGLFIALIVVNCAILGRAEAFAARNAPLASFVDGLGSGLGFTFGLLLIGIVREVLGSGTLFANAALLLGSPFKVIELTIIPHYSGFLLMVLPPGGFLALGFLSAGKQWPKPRAPRRVAKTVELAAMPAASHS